MPIAESVISPRLETLRQAIEAGYAEALDAFWREVIEQGTPLIEEIEGDEEHSLATFLWHASEMKSVAMVSLLSKPAVSPMTHLAHTDVWYKTCRVRNDLRTTYQFVLEDPLHPIAERDDYRKRWASWRPDPLNPHTFAFFDDEEDPTEVKLVRSVLELPAAPPQPWIEPRSETPAGRIELHRMRSAILGNERRTWVYTPPSYAPDRDESYGLLILFDGWAYVKLVPTPVILDNLLSAGRIPPLVAVLVDSLSVETRLQEYVCHKPFNDFLVKELVPWIQANYHVTSDPRQIVVGGSSAGGLAAAYAGLEHPETFGNILSQSGAFALMPDGEEEHEWLARQFAERSQLPLKFYFDAGSLETNSLRDLGDGPSLLVAHRHMRNVLRAKGYAVHYSEFSGGHDYICWRGTLPDALQALIGTA